MGSVIARMIKVVAVITWIGGFICGFIPAFQSLFSGDMRQNFNFGLMLLVWIMYFLLGLFTYGFAEIIDNLAILRKKLVPESLAEEEDEERCEPGKEFEP